MNERIENQEIRAALTRIAAGQPPEGRLASGLSGLIVEGFEFPRSGLEALAPWTGAAFRRCSFVDADLSDLDFSESLFDGVDFGGACLERACFEDCVLIDCVLDGAVATGAESDGITIRRSSLRDVEHAFAMASGDLLECDFGEGDARSFRPRVSEPGLEEVEHAIASGDPSAWRVYADRLLELGDPRGARISLGLARAEAGPKERGSLDASIAELIERHPAALGLPLSIRTGTFCGQVLSLEAHNATTQLEEWATQLDRPLSRWLQFIDASEAPDHNGSVRGLCTDRGWSMPVRTRATMSLGWGLVFMVSPRSTPELLAFGTHPTGFMMRLRLRTESELIERWCGWDQALPHHRRLDSVDFDGALPEVGWGRLLVDLRVYPAGGDCPQDYSGATWFAAGEWAVFALERTGWLSGGAFEPREEPRPIGVAPTTLAPSGGRWSLLTDEPAWLQQTGRTQRLVWGEGPGNPEGLSAMSSCEDGPCLSVDAEGIVVARPAPDAPVGCRERIGTSRGEPRAAVVFHEGLFYLRSAASLRRYAPSSGTMDFLSFRDPWRERRMPGRRGRIGFHPAPARSAWLRPLTQEPPMTALEWHERDGATHQLLLQDGAPQGTAAAVVLGDGRVVALTERFIWLCDPDAGESQCLALRPSGPGHFELPSTIDAPAAERDWKTNRRNLSTRMRHKRERITELRGAAPSPGS